MPSTLRYVPKVARSIAKLLLVVTLVTAGHGRASGQPTPAPSSEAPAWTVQVDPLTTALGFVHVQVERRLHPAISLYAGPHARLFAGLGSEADEDHTGIGAEVGVRWFPKQTAPAGWWLLGRGVLARVSHDGGSEPGGYGSVLVGYTFIARDRWVLSGGAGAQYIHYKVDDVGTETFFPALHTAVGAAF